MDPKPEDPKQQNMFGRAARQNKRAMRQSYGGTGEPPEATYKSKMPLPSTRKTTTEKPIKHDDDPEVRINNFLNPKKTETFKKDRSYSGQRTKAADYSVQKTSYAEESLLDQSTGTIT